MAEQEYTIHLNNVVRIPRTRYANKVVFAIREFVKKHTHAKHENIRLSNDVNQEAWARGLNFKINRINVVLRKRDDKVYVFTPSGKDLKAFEKTGADTKKKDAKEKKEAKVEEKKDAIKLEKAEAKGETPAKAEKKEKVAAPKTTKA